MKPENCVGRIIYYLLLRVSIDTLLMLTKVFKRFRVVTLLESLHLWFSTFPPPPPSFPCFLITPRHATGHVGKVLSSRGHCFLSTKTLNVL